MYLAALAIIAALLIHAWMYIVPAPSEIDYEREYSGFVYMIMGVLYGPGSVMLGISALMFREPVRDGLRLGLTLVAACWTLFATLWVMVSP